MLYVNHLKRFAATGNCNEACIGDLTTRREVKEGDVRSSLCKGKERFIRNPKAAVQRQVAEVRATLDGADDRSIADSLAVGEIDRLETGEIEGECIKAFVGELWIVTKAKNIESLARFSHSWIRGKK